MLRMLMPANKPSVPPMAASLPEKLIVSSLLDLIAILLGWFSIGMCKYKPGYKLHDLL